MDSMEQDYINKNLSSLLNTVRLSTQLMVHLREHGLLSSADEDQVNSKATEIDKGYHLIQILKTRKGGYEGLLGALKVTGQNGATQILEDIKNNHEFYRNALSQPFHCRQMNDIVAPTDVVSNLQLSWEQIIQDNSDLFTSRNLSEDALYELINAFYSKEAKKRLENKKYVGISFFETINNELNKAIMQGLFRKVPHLHLDRISEMVVRNFQIMKKSFILSLNANPNINGAPAIGIDLGTCNCCVAVWLNGKVKVFSNNLGEKTTPSFVAFSSSGTIEVGKTAKKKAFRNPEYTVYDAKRMIGRGFKDKDVQADRQNWPFTLVEDNGVPKIVVPHKTVSAEEISEILLRECVQQAEADLQKKVTKAVITVPAYFNNSQIKATKTAGEMAGLKVLKILKEPTAAAITYSQERNYQLAKRVLIFDMGGGTFDVAVADISDDEVNIIGIDGDTHLGGEDFDQKIFDFCIDSFKKNTGNDLRKWKTPANDRRNLSDLRGECEEAKKYLSTSNDVEISIAHDEDTLIMLTRETFEKLCEELFSKMMAIVERLLKETNVKKHEIEDIILVGGSTRIPKLKSILSQHFNGKHLNHNANQDYAVAYGAAIVAATMNGEDVKNQLKLPNVKDVIPFSIGVQCIKKNVAGKFSKIINKNSKYPDVYKETYVTQKDNQEAATIQVYQGECENVAENFYLGEFRFEGIPRARQGKETVEVCMEVDIMGILHVTANCRGRYGSQVLKVSLNENRVPNSDTNLA